MAPILDLFITLLSMGQDGYEQLLRERQRLREVLQRKLAELTAKHSLSILPADKNTISTGVSLEGLLSAPSREGLTFLGSMLFQRSVSGCRVVECLGDKKNMSGVEFTNWGAHIDNYPCSYFTVACSIGITERDIDVFVDRLDKVLIKFKKQVAKAEPVDA